MNEGLLTLGSAALGSVMQELVYWFNLRHNLEAEAYQKLIKSPGYWALVVLMVIGAALTSLVWFSGSPSPPPKDAFVFGVGVPLMIKNLGSTVGNQVRFGSPSMLSSYFRRG